MGHIGSTISNLVPLDNNIFNCPPLAGTYGSVSCGHIQILFACYQIPWYTIWSFNVWNIWKYFTVTFGIFQCTLLTKPGNIHVICIYRPNGSVQRFLEELDTWLSLCCTCIENILSFVQASGQKYEIIFWNIGFFWLGSTCHWTHHPSGMEYIGPNFFQFGATEMPIYKMLF